MTIQIIGLAFKFGASYGLFRQEDPVLSMVGIFLGLAFICDEISKDYMKTIIGRNSNDKDYR